MTFTDHVDILSQKILKARLVAVEIGCVCPVQLGCRACWKQCPFFIDCLEFRIGLGFKIGFLKVRSRQRRIIAGGIIQRYINRCVVSDFRLCLSQIINQLTRTFLAIQLHFIAIDGCLLWFRSDFIIEYERQ